MVPLNAYAVDSSSDFHIHFVSQDISSPKSQFENGIAIDKIVCQTGLELVMKKSDDAPTCVKPVSVSKLVERGWALHVLPDYSKDNTNSEAFARGDHYVITDEVNYFENYTGFVARPDNTENYPGIVMIHEWWGLNDNIRDMAKELASHGYVVLAVDLYGQHAATTADEARQLVSSYDLQHGISNMNAAVDYLVNNYNAKKIGSIGFVFGGNNQVNYFESTFGIYGIFAAFGLVFLNIMVLRTLLMFLKKTKNSKKTIPKVIIFFILIIGIIYVLVSLASLQILSWEELGASKAPIADIARKMLGTSGYTILSIIALFVITNTVLILNISGSRIMYGISNENSLPKFFSKIYHKTMLLGLQFFFMYDYLDNIFVCR